MQIRYDSRWIFSIELYNSHSKNNEGILKCSRAYKIQFWIHIYLKTPFNQEIDGNGCRFLFALSDGLWSYFLIKRMDLDRHKGFHLINS